MPYAHVRDAVVRADGELHIENLPFRSGERVQVFVMRRRELDPNAPRYPLHGRPIRYDDPFEPAIDPLEWEANQ